MGFGHRHPCEVAFGSEIARTLAARLTHILNAALSPVQVTFIQILCVCCRFAVLNDFEAIGYGVPVVPEEDLVVLHDAPVSPKVKQMQPFELQQPLLDKHLCSTSAAASGHG